MNQQGVDILLKAGEYMSTETWVTKEWAAYLFDRAEDADEFSDLLKEHQVAHLEPEWENDKWQVTIDPNAICDVAESTLFRIPDKMCAVGAIDWFAGSLGYGQPAANDAVGAVAAVIRGYDDEEGWQFDGMSHSQRGRVFDYSDTDPTKGDRTRQILHETADVLSGMN